MGICKQCKREYYGTVECPFCKMADLPPHTKNQVSIQKFLSMVLIIVGTLIAIPLFTFDFDDANQSIEGSPSIESNQAQTVPLTQPQEIIRSTDGDNVITYNIKSVAKVPDRSIPPAALEKAIKTWETLNPGLKFREVENSNVDFSLHWKAFHGQEHSGRVQCFVNCLMEITLGAIDCNGKYIQAETDLVTNIIMHEIGHVLFIEHTIDKKHLMYGIDGVPLEDFDALGFNIPPRLPSFYVGEKELYEQWHSMDAELKKLTADLGDNAQEIKVLEEKIDTITEELSCNKKNINEN